MQRLYEVFGGTVDGISEENTMIAVYVLLRGSRSEKQDVRTSFFLLFPF